MIFLTVIGCKNNIRKAFNYPTDLFDWYQLYISFKNNIETAIPMPLLIQLICNHKKHVFMTADGYSCNHAE